MHKQKLVHELRAFADLLGQQQDYESSEIVKNAADAIEELRDNIRMRLKAIGEDVTRIKKELFDKK